MPELTPKQLKNLERLSKIVEEGGVGILENLLETEEKMEAHHEEMEKMMKEKMAEVDDKMEKMEAKMPDMKSVLEQIKGKDGPEGPQGPQGVQGVQGAAGKNGRDGKDGRDGRDGKDGQSIVGPAGKDADETAIQDRIEKNLPSLGSAIRDGLELLPDGEKLKIEAVQNLREELDELKKKRGNLSAPSGTGASGGRIVKVHDLTDSLNGVLATFSLPAFWRVISVHSTSFPFVFRPTTDYTTDASAMTITFTSQIDPASTLATGQTLLVVYAEA